MFRGNIPCTITRKKGYTVSGEQTFFAPVASRCSVVTLETKAQHTTVRADSSATRGFAEESVTEAKLLFGATTKLEIDDKITVDGLNVRVYRIFPRRTANGLLDHIEILGSKWD